MQRFNNGDPVSIHTLAAAAYNLIRDITKKKGARPMIVKDQVVEGHVKDEYKKKFRDKLNEAENFFKHADRDHSKTLEFAPESSEFLIFDAVQQYCRLTGENAPVLGVFWRWFLVRYLELFNKMPDPQMAELVKSRPAALALGRTRFFKEALPMLALQVSGGCAVVKR